MKLSKLSGYIIIVGVQIVAVLFVLMLIIEFGHDVLGIKDKRATVNTILNTNKYYNKYYREDPYSKFTVQHLHPYYLFSLPWKLTDINRASNDVVMVNEDGFRINPLFNNRIEKGVLLGGSTAFGHYSSGNNTTPAAILTEKINIDITNRNAPSWNSHQELVAILKYKEKYNLSLSLTLANDIEVGCKENNSWDEGEKYIDSPESFILLSGKINDIRGEIIPSSWIVLAKDWLKSLFPYSYLLYKNITSENNDTGSVEYKCDISPNLIAKRFIENQSAMSEIAKSRNAAHVTILQPYFGKYRGFSSYKEKVYGAVMRSSYCKNSHCLDLSSYEMEDPMILSENGISAQFIDELHLSDIGNEIYMSFISDYLEKNNLIN